MTVITLSLIPVLTEMRCHSLSRTIIVKCERCGTEYEMPDIGIKPIMKDCPICKQVDKMAKDVLGDLYCLP